MIHNKRVVWIKGDFDINTAKNSHEFL